MKPDSPKYGPQLDKTDGTIGKNIQLVKRWVLVHRPEADMFSSRQGTYTRATRHDAQDYCDTVKESNHKDLVPSDLRVACWWCYPGHFDPVCPVDDGH